MAGLQVDQEVAEVLEASPQRECASQLPSELPSIGATHSRYLIAQALRSNWKDWWARQVSNLRPTDYESAALTN